MAETRYVKLKFPSTALCGTTTVAYNEDVVLLRPAFPDFATQPRLVRVAVHPYCAEVVKVTLPSGEMESKLFWALAVPNRPATSIASKNADIFLVL